MERNSTKALIILLILAGAAFFLIRYVTATGMVITGDSVRYIMGAENMIAGNGYSRLDGYGNPKPIVGFPPGYPATISLLLLLGTDALTAVRVINVFLFCANVFLTGWLIWRSSRKLILAVLGSSSMLGFPVMLMQHRYAMSEPGFIFLSLIAFLLLSEYLQRNRISILLVLGLVLGIAPLYRYVALSMLPVVLLLLWLFSKEAWKKRLTHSLILAAEALLPTFLWFRRNAALAGTTTNRGLIYHPLPMEKLVAYLDEVVSWFIPSLLQLEWRPRFSHAGMALIVITVLFLAYKYWTLIRVHSAEQEKSPYRLLSLFSFLFMYSYMATVFLSTIFLDASMSAYQRYLLPVYVHLVIFILCLFADLLDSGRVWKMLAGAGVFCWVFVYGFHFQHTFDSIDAIRSVNSYEGWAERASAAGEFLDSLGPSTVILTNEIDLVYMLNGRYSFLIPIKMDSYTRQAREDFEHQLDAYREKMAEGAVVVLFDSLDRLAYKYASYEQLTEGYVLIHASNTVEIFADPEGFPVEEYAAP